MLSRNIPAKSRDALLARAAARNLLVEVSVIGRRSRESLKSRVLHRGEPLRDPLLIEVPTQNGRPIALHPGDVLDLLVVVDGERFGFRVPVQGRGRARLGGNVEVAAIALDYPRVIARLQRRRYYRVRIPSLNPIIVQCIARRPGLSGHAERSDDGLSRFDAVALDISAGGMGLKLRAQRAEFARAGLHIALQFPVAGAHDVRLVAEIRYVRPIPQTDDLFLGTRFVDADKTLAGRRAIDAVTRYVTVRQREELKRKSGLE